MNNGSSGSRMVLAKPRLGGFGSSSFGASSSSNTSCNPFSNVLRPPQLKPTSNPFVKVSGSDVKSVDDSKESKDVEAKPEVAKEEADAPKFVPLASSGVTSRSTGSVPAPTQPSSTNSSSGFVFGQNLSERVVIKENANNGEVALAEDHSSHSSSNGASELLFSSAAASVKENNQEENVECSSSGAGLAEAAAEYERSHARPPPPAAATTFTGEEGEANVLQISCRLYAWEEGSWRERGRGVVRLNDCGEAGGGGARLVARATGSLRVLINTKLWADMVLQRAGHHSIRLTAMDAAHQVKLFLIMGAPGDINHLFRELTGRVALSKRTEQNPQNSASQDAAERLEAVQTNQDSQQNNDSIQVKRIDNSDLKTEDDATLEDDELNKVSKPLKRKEPVDNQTSPKRQCPEIVNE